jgi:hypothetical protein
MPTYESLEIVGYSHSNFADCLGTDRSTSSYVFKLAGGLYHGVAPSRLS